MVACDASQHDWIIPPFHNFPHVLHVFHRLRLCWISYFEIVLNFIIWIWNFSLTFLLIFALALICLFLSFISLCFGQFIFFLFLIVFLLFISILNFNYVRLNLFDCRAGLDAHFSPRFYSTVRFYFYFNRSVITLPLFYRFTRVIVCERPQPDERQPALTSHQSIGTHPVLCSASKLLFIQL